MTRPMVRLLPARSARAALVADEAELSIASSDALARVAARPGRAG